jgi:hypothetical protein
VLIRIVAPEGADSDPIGYPPITIGHILPRLTRSGAIW